MNLVTEPKIDNSLKLVRAAAWYYFPSPHYFQKPETREIRQDSSNLKTKLGDKTPDSKG